MKTKLVAGSLVAFCIALTTANLAKAQDTVRVRETVYEVVKVKKGNRNGDQFYRCELGARYLPTFTSLKLNTSTGNTVKGDVTLSNGFGIMLGFNLSENVGIQAEVDYNEIMQKYKDQILEREVHLNYINIPVLFSLNTDKTLPVNLNLVLGPQFGINVGSSLKTGGTSETETAHAVIAVKEGDVGVAYGAGLEIGLNKPHTLRLDFGFRGMYGLVNINVKDTSPNTFNVLVDASRKSYGGYIGLAWLF